MAGRRGMLEEGVAERRVAGRGSSWKKGGRKRLA